MCSLSEAEMNTVFQTEKLTRMLMPAMPIANAPVIERSRNERSRKEQC